MKDTKILLFLLKIMSYIQYDERIEVFEKVEEFYQSNENYKKLIKYYKKVWINNS